MTVYYTLGADAHKIPEGAAISAAASEAEALAAMKASYEGSDLRVTGLERGDFGDCWVKAHNLSQSLLDTLRDEAGELCVQGPGQHPGIHCYWITPASDVFVPILEEIEHA